MKSTQPFPRPRDVTWGYCRENTCIKNLIIDSWNDNWYLKHQYKYNETTESEYMLKCWL